MGRLLVRTEILLPIFSSKLKEWGVQKRTARVLIGIDKFMDEQAFYRVLRSEDSSPDEIALVGKAIYEYGKRYQLPGWEKLENF